MRERTPSFDRTPLSRERKREREVAQIQIDSHSPTVIHEPLEVMHARIEDAQERAQAIASSLEQIQTEPAPEPHTQEPVVKQSFADRIRTFFRIPKSISAELKQLNENDVRAVDAFNADERQMPPINRKPNKLSRALLIGTTLGALGTTHEPQIESAAKEGIQIAKKLERKAESALIDAKDFLIKNKPFGKEAFAEGKENSKGVRAGNEDGRDSTNTEGQESHARGYDKLTKTLSHLSEAQKNIAEKLLRDQERGYGSKASAEFFLGLEFLHGQITEEQMEEALTHFNELTSAVHDQLSTEQDGLNDAVRIAFELAKQRTTYARDHADMYSMITNHEGNCEALVLYELAAIPKVMGKTPSMAVQAYHDHVRLLVRNDPRDPWTWIDGHQLGTLSIEDAKGTLILDPNDVIEQALQLKDRVKKPPQEGSDYTTNSLLHWETLDGRISTKRHSLNTPPLRADETQETKQTFKQASNRPEDHMHIIPVPVEFVGGNSEPSPEAKPAEKIIQAPDSETVMDALKSGILNGTFNDLSPLEGIALEQVILHTSTNEHETIDLAPLSSSPLKKIILEESAEPKGFEKISFKNLQEVSVDIHATEFLHKALMESEHLENVRLVLPTPSTFEEHVAVYKNGPDAGAQEFKTLFSKIEKKLLAQQSGNILVTIYSPFEDIYSTWTFEGKTGTWKIDYGDYLSQEARANLQTLAEEGELRFPDNLKNDAYLLEEKIDMSKIEHVTFEVKEAQENDTSVLRFDKKLDALRTAKNLETITIDVDTNIGELDLSNLNALKFKKLIIHYSYLSAEKPHENLLLKGLESSKIKIEYKR